MGTVQKIILVDDVKSFKPTISRSDVVVYTATSGEEVLDIHQREKVNLILLSRYMPGMDGEQVCKTIKSNDAIKNVAIVMLMAGLKIEDIEKCISSVGADDYIIKPFTPSEFVNKVRQFINIPVRENMRILTKLTVNAKMGTESIMGNTVDISVRGMLLETEKQMDMGTAVKCEFSIPDSPNEIAVNGNIVRKIDGKVPPFKRYGIKFTNLDHKSEMVIEKYVFKQQRQQLRDRVR